LWKDIDGRLIESGGRWRMFLGTYFHNIDEKGRVILPASFRRALEEQGASNRIIITGQNKCLSVYTREEWEKSVEKMKQIAMVKPEAEYIIRRMCADAAECGIDEQGRLNIPVNLKEYGGFKKEVVTVGRMNKMEIWDKGLWAAEYQKMVETSLSESVTKELNGLWI